MVVELLTLTIDPSIRDEWLAADEARWTRFLAQQDGFVRKEVWWSREQADHVRVVVWWASMEQWAAIPQAALDEVIAEMGDLEHHAVCDAYDLVRSA